MARKLAKRIDGTVISFDILQEDGDVKTLMFDTVELPDEIQKKLAPFGLGHKLGDSAASSNSPEDTEAAILGTWEALKEGNWTLRKPAEPKEKTARVSKKSLLEGLQNLSEDERSIAAAILQKLGITV